MKSIFLIIQLDPVLIGVLLWSANAEEEDIAKILFIRDKR